MVNNKWNNYKNTAHYLFTSVSPGKENWSEGGCVSMPKGVRPIKIARGGHTMSPSTLIHCQNNNISRILKWDLWWANKMMELSAVLLPTVVKFKQQQGSGSGKCMWKDHGLRVFMIWGAILYFPHTYKHHIYILYYTATVIGVVLHIFGVMNQVICWKLITFLSIYLHKILTLVFECNRRTLVCCASFNFLIFDMVLVFNINGQDALGCLMFDC